MKLRPTEHLLLYHLIENAGWTVSREQLLAQVWGYEYREETHYIRLYINYLRKKIEADPAHPQYIHTERGIGYRFVDFHKGQPQEDRCLYRAHRYSPDWDCIATLHGG